MKKELFVLLLLSFALVAKAGCDDEPEDDDDDDGACERNYQYLIDAVTSWDFEVFGKVQG